MKHLLRHCKHVLCIDDYQTALAAWCLYLQGEGYCVTGASSPQEGLEIFATQQVDAVVLDYAMPKLTGDTVAAWMKKMKRDVSIIMFTGVSDVEGTAGNKVDALVEKGCQPGVLLGLIDNLFQIHDAAVSH
jgi:CheY-like chemotaxis protein